MKTSDRDDSMASVLIAIIAMLLGGMLAAGIAVYVSQPEQGRYVASRMLHVAVLEHLPEHGSGKRHVPQRVVLRIGAQAPTPYAMPSSCSPASIRARVGRKVTMRQDEWRLHDGAIRRTIDPIEMTAAVCGLEPGHDLPRGEVDDLAAERGKSDER
jgi:hypothetical protein